MAISTSCTSASIVARANFHWKRKLMYNATRISEKRMA
jgi:hypothetical protein